ncbi:MAG: oligopeptide transporter, OPT family [Candidatus Marinimicrobia bacterium]|nr:oligopeptide transporter, OPT family [Candidatus Neomarinimicrobiota bacterium]
MANKEFKPYVPIDTNMKELTFKALFLGVILAVILGAANAYLGLKAGMTVAATFPAAVISMAVLRLFKGTILEENIARTTGAVGEALAAGAIFTLPAFIMTGVWSEFNYVKSTLLMLVGGILGVLLVIILRKTMVEDTTLPYPESRACAEIVKAGQGRQSGAKFVFSSIGLAAFIELFKNPNGILIIKDSVKGFLQFGLSKINLLNAEAQVLTAGVQKAEFSQKGGMLLQSPAASPAFLGVGYIIGFKLSAITFSGGLFGWLFLMPIVLFLMYNNLHPFAEAGGNWINVAASAYNSTVKPIAVGGMLVGAFYTLFKMRKSLIGGIARGFSDIRTSKGSKSNKIARTEKDAPFGLVLIAIGVLILCMIFLYHSFTAQWGSAILAAVVMGIAGFVFAAVAGYLVGIIGSSSNPISGLTLSTLLIAALLMVLVGMKGNPGIAAVLGVASVVCCVAGVAGDMLQDWKVGHILGGTPWKMQVGGMIGVIAAALVLIIPIMLLHEANVIGSDALPAPQAGLMAMMSKGIVGGEMAWPLVITGMFFAIGLILIGSPSPMLISVGMYLPFSTTFAIFIGGLIKHITDRVSKKRIKNQKDKNIVDNTGLLVASGLVAGEALLGIILAGLVVGNINLSQLVGLPVDFQGFWWLGLVIFLVLGYVLIKYPYNELIKAQSKEK